MNSLHLAQSVLGFLQSVQEETDMYISANMVEYLTELFQNMCDHCWSAAKGAHLVMLTGMEDGLITWSDLKRVNIVCKTYISGSSSSHGSQVDNGSVRHNKKGPRKQSTVPCEGRGSKTSDHDQGLITHKHVCTYCLYTYSHLYNHTESQYNNKRRKNGNVVSKQ